MLHGVDVEQQIDGVNQRADFPRTPEFDAVAGAIENLGRPEAVEILVDVARDDGVGGVESAVCSDVHEGEGELAPVRPHSLAQQVVDGMRAAELVAVHQRTQHHMRAGCAAVEHRHIVDPGVSPAILRDVERTELDGVRIGDHFRGAIRWSGPTGSLPVRSLPLSR